MIQPEPAKLLITAYKDDHVLSEAERIGISEFIEKPFSFDALVKSLAGLIRNGKEKNIKVS